MQTSSVVEALLVVGIVGAVSYGTVVIGAIIAPSALDHPPMEWNNSNTSSMDSNPLESIPVEWNGSNTSTIDAYNGGPETLGDNGSSAAGSYDNGKESPQGMTAGSTSSVDDSPGMFDVENQAREPFSLRGFFDRFFGF